MPWDGSRPAIVLDYCEGWTVWFIGEEEGAETLLRNSSTRDAALGVSRRTALEMRLMAFEVRLDPLKTTATAKERPPSHGAQDIQLAMEL